MNENSPGRHQRKMQHVTMAEVAQAAGVSPSTVSLYLRKPTLVSPAPGEEVGRPIERRGYVPSLAADDALLRDLVEPLLKVIALMDEEAERLSRRVVEEVREEPICRRLMTVPEMGAMTALAFRATIDQPERFRHSRDVGAHLGLTPSRYQSGETDRQGRISRCGDELARTALCEAAHSLLIRCTKWSALRACGMRIARRRGMARGPGCRGPQAGGDPAPDLARWRRVPLGQAAGNDRRMKTGRMQVSA